MNCADNDCKGYIGHEFLRNVSVEFFPWIKFFSVFISPFSDTCYLEIHAWHDTGQRNLIIPLVYLMY